MLLYFFYTFVLLIITLLSSNLSINRVRAQAGTNPCDACAGWLCCNSNPSDALYGVCVECSEGCFPKSTQVEIENGQSKNIENIEIGEKVMSQDEQGNKSISTVSELKTQSTDNMCQINFVDGEKLKLTKNHRLFTNYGWEAIDPESALKENSNIEAGQLKTGDIVTKSDGNNATVDYYSCWSENSQTYNLVLDGTTNTYFANGFLAHNKLDATWVCPDGYHVEYSDPPVYFLLASNNSYCHHAATCIPPLGAIYSDWPLSSHPEYVVRGCRVAPDPTINACSAGEGFCQECWCIPNNSNPIGYHDTADCSLIQGWSCDSDDYSQALQIHVYEGSTFLGATTANVPREVGVANSCGGYADHGFAFTTPDSLKDGLPHSITTYAINIPAGTNIALTNSPRTITCPAVSSCTVSLSPSSYEMSQSSTQDFTAAVTPTNGTVDRVDFSSSNTGVASVSPTSVSSPSYTTTATGNAAGSVTITADVYMGGVLTCSDTSSLTITALPNDPWWQIIDGDVTSNGSISSNVPASNVFIQDGLGGFPGLPVYANSLNTNSNPISSTSWEANTSTSFSRIFNYSFFANLVPDDVVFIDPSTTPLDSGGSEYSDGYYWYRADSGLDINSDVNLGDRKVILFVTGGDLNINANVNLNDGSGFLLAISDEGININSSVSGSPSIEGLYVSDGNFTSGAGTSQLHIRGSVASYGGFSLQRDLADDSDPAELFEYAPDQILLFPSKLSVRRTRWNEIAP